MLYLSTRGHPDRKRFEIGRTLPKDFFSQGQRLWQAEFRFELVLVTAS